MACFWKGIQKSLVTNDFKIFYDYQDITYVPKLVTLVQFLQEHNCKTDDISCNGELCSEKMLDENMEAIKDYNIKHIHQGYYCSTADPFLFLLSKLFNVNIYHNYNGHIIEYLNPNYMRSIYFYSNRSHFSYKKTIHKQNPS